MTRDSYFPNSMTAGTNSAVYNAMAMRGVGMSAPQLNQMSTASPFGAKTPLPPTPGPNPPMGVVKPKFPKPKAPKAPNEAMMIVNALANRLAQIGGQSANY